VTREEADDGDDPEWRVAIDAAAGRWPRAAAEWSPTRWMTLGILAIALVAGCALRFYRLDLTGMTADEWAAAIAHPVRRVIQLQSQLDPGKLALYDLVLHGWMKVFGDGLRSIRGLSAGIGTGSIVLLFLLMRELYRAFAGAFEIETGELAGAFAALVFATNSTIVSSGRMSRMYALMLAAELAHILFFVRAQRHGGLLNYTLTAGFLAIAVATNFSSAFLLVSEGLWFGYLLLARWEALPGEDLRVIGPGLAIVAGLVLLLPFASNAITASQSAIQAGFLRWIHIRSLLWPYDILRWSIANNWLFWLLVALAALGVWRLWTSARLLPLFVGTWFAGPFLAVLALSWLITPLMVWRYVLVAFVAFFAIVAVGAALFRSNLARAVVALLILSLSVYSVRDFRAPNRVDWKRAALAAISQIAPDGQIAVVPSYAANVVRYYLPAQGRRSVVGLDFGCGTQQVLILSGRTWLPPSLIAAMEACYPRRLRQLENVEVRGR
jgi:mannosyltransferase